VATLLFPAALAVIVGLGFFRFLMALPRRTMALFSVAAAVFVAGGLAVDFAGELHKNRVGADTPVYAAVSGIEEALEMAGVLLFLNALLDYIRHHVPVVRISVR
jgi:hypothetical protein